MGNYVDIADVRAEGFDEATYPDYTDPRVTRAITLAESYVETVTGQRFYRPAAAEVLKLDGHGRDLLHLTKAICQGDDQVSKVELGRIGPREISLDDVVVYNGAGDRRNPKLAFDPQPGSMEQIWPEGRQNVRITGWFGFTDYDGALVGDLRWFTPPEIVDCVLRVVAIALPLLDDPESTDRARAGRVLTERTRARSITYGKLTTGGPTGDPQIDGTLARFRRPAAGYVV